MGTPDFAVPSLEALIEAGHEVVGVVTAPDKPAGRGRQLTGSPVKEAALRHHLPVWQPEKLRDPGFLHSLEQAHADLFVVVAFRMLPEVVWKMPPRGTLNLHASLLPDYRGAAPINHVIINGESRTGITTFFIEKEIDTGHILLQAETPIPPEWNAGDLHDHLCAMGARLVVQTVDALEKGQLKAVPQQESDALHAAPKIFREHCKINFSENAGTIHNLVRGLSPYPAAWCEAGGQTVKIYRTALTGNPSKPAVPGTVRSGKGVLEVATGDEWLAIEELQPEGRRKMETQAYLAGHTPPDQFS